LSWHGTSGEGADSKLSGDWSCPENRKTTFNNRIGPYASHPVACETLFMPAVRRSPIEKHRTGGSGISSTNYEPSEQSEPWRGKTWIQLLAVVIGVLPLYSGAIIHQLWRGQPPSSQRFIIYLAVISPLAIVVALLLLRFLCKENYRDLNLKPGSLSSDSFAALILSIVVLVTNVVSQNLLSGLFPASAPNLSVRNLFLEMGRSPGLLIVFIGPLVFLGAASEELIRVFLLSRLWKIWPETPSKIIAVVISACAFGLIHLYQGPVHVIMASIFGLIMALYYLRFGRVLPMILAHYLTNALQVVVANVLAR
jgi:membrane protease YdiL (CAAX protease family)